MGKYVLYVRNKNNRETEFFVSLDEKDPNKCIPVAVFPFGERYPEDEQLLRARDYVRFMNLLEEAKEKAAQEITITSTVAKRLLGNQPCPPSNSKQ